MKRFDCPLIDLRSPSEFAQGHIPGALSLPLFSDEERHRVGLLYAQSGQAAALELGLTFVGPKMAYFVQLARKVAREGRVALYCWRGGMRSQSVAQLFQMAGLKVERIEGGYKRFRRWVLSQLAAAPQVRVVGGYTGSGKTAILHHLRALGAPVVDLEGLANHRGSSFGSLGLGRQPSQEQFENRLAWELMAHGEGPIWVEDESRMVGSCQIPTPLYEAMRSAPLFLVSRSLAERKERLIRDYGAAPKEQLVAAIRRLEKRLGGARMQEAIQRVECGNLDAIDPLLDYYDRDYARALERRRGEVIPLPLEGGEDEVYAKELLEQP